MTNVRPAPTSSTVGTFFLAGLVRHFDWGIGEYLVPTTAPAASVSDPKSLPLSAFNIPFDAIDAACVNPLDGDIVWLFHKAELVEYQVSERRALTYATSSGSQTPLWKIKEHPIFRGIPSRLHDGVTAVVTDAPRVSGRERFDAFIHVYGEGQHCAARVVSLRGAVHCSIEVVRGGFFIPELDPGWDVARREALLAPFQPRPELGTLRGVVRGAGASSGELFQFAAKQFVKVPLQTSESAPPPVLSRSGWNETFPKAALPVRLLAGTAQARRTPTGKRSTHAVAETVEPPDMLVAIPERRPIWMALSKTSEWFAEIQRLYPFRGQKYVPIRVQRMKAFVDRIKQGDMPNFLRYFVPVRATHEARPDCELVYYVMPDLVAIGGDDDFVRVPLTPSAAQEIADHFKCLLPTARMASQIYLAEDAQLLKLIPYRDGNLYTSTEYILQHDAAIRAEHRRLGYTLGRLTAGHKKEIVAPDESELEALGTCYWGGLIELSGELSPHQDMRTIRVFHPEEKRNDGHVLYPVYWASESAYRAASPTQRGGQKGREALDTATRTHTDEQNTGHDEYAQGARLVSRVAYLKEGAAPWRPVDLVRDVLANDARFKLAHKFKIKDAEKYHRYADAWARWPKVKVKVNGQDVNLPNEMTTAIQIKEAALAQGVKGTLEGTLSKGVARIEDHEQLAPEEGEGYTLR